MAIFNSKLLVYQMVSCLILLLVGAENPRQVHEADVSDSAALLEAIQGAEARPTGSRMLVEHPSINGWWTGATPILLEVTTDHIFNNPNSCCS